VFDKALVAGHVDYARQKIVPESVVGKTQLYGDAPFLFFFESVAVDAGECFYQSRLAMVDVSRGADNDLLHTVNITG
jgi:hypothetical protein